MASRHIVAFGSLVFVVIVLTTVSSCTGPECSDGGEGCSCTSAFDCDKFPSSCYRAYCDGTCHFVPFPVGGLCVMDPCSPPEPCAQGFCNAESGCVQCLENSHCSAGHTCEPDNVCSQCDDGFKNGDESDVDCGGSCPLCPGNCNVDADCKGGYCWKGACARCDDGIENGDETGVDCGVYEGHCPICFGTYCSSNDDCASKTCEFKYCCATPCPLCYECGPPSGECVPIPFGKYDFVNAANPQAICYADFVCDGNGKCGRVKNQPCMQNEECASAMCLNGKCG